MARIRSIKPEFWTHAQVVECSTNARLLFIGLWNFCDDEGRHPLAYKQIKAEVFPADDFSLDDIRRMIDELSSNGLIVIYSVENKDFFYIDGWRHQKIDRPQPAKYPDPEIGIRRTLDECSTLDRIKEGKGEEGNTPSLRSGVDTPKEKRKFRRSLPDNFPLEEDRKWAEEYWLKRGRADLCTLMGEEIEKFRDHHKGKLTASADWPGSWRTWTRNAIKFSNGAHNGRPEPKRTAHDKFLAGGLQALERFRGE